MMRLFVLVYVGLVGLGASLAAWTGYSTMSIVVAGWVFPSVLFSLLFLPPIAIRRIADFDAPRAHSGPTDMTMPLRHSVLLELVETKVDGVLASR